MGASEDDIEVSLNKDYTASTLDPTELRELVGAWQSGAISKASLFHNLQQGEVIPPDRTFEEEEEMIGAEAPDFDFGEAAGGGA